MSGHRIRAAMLLGALLAIALVAQAGAQETAAAPADDEADAADDVAAQAFARMDSDRDGQLSLEEFEKGIYAPRGSNRSGVVYQRLPARFRALDGDTSGYLEAAEFAAMVQRWQGPGEPPALATADQNGDGKLDFREFAALHAPRDETAAASR